MKKIFNWILILLIVILPISTARAGNIEIQAVEGANVDLSQYEIIKPVAAKVSTPDKNLLVSGKAVPGSEVIIELYGTSDLTKKTYNLTNLPLEEDYILILEEAIKTGNMGYFQKQLILVNGVNKVIIDFAEEGIIPVKILAYAYDKQTRTSSVVREIQISHVKPLLK